MSGNFSEGTVSIVIPVYNAEKYLPICLRSVLRQSYKNLEVILVNDGSKDGSLEICRKFAEKDARVRVIDIPNGGVSNARNTGVAAATGEYIQFVDSDDLIHRNMSGLLVKAMQQNQADIAFCGIKMVFKKNTRRDLELTKRWFADRYVMGREEFLSRMVEACLFHGGMQGPCNRMYRRSLIEENGLRFPPEINYGEDFLFNMQYYAHCNTAVFLHKVMYYYMQYNAQSLSHTCTLTSYVLQMRLVDELEKMLAEQIGLSDKMKQELARYRSNKLRDILEQYCAEENGLSRSEKEKALHDFLHTDGVLEMYYGVHVDTVFAETIDPFVRAQDAAGILEAVPNVRAQLKEDGKRPVTMFFVRKLRAYSEAHPETRSGNAARILYLNLATTGIGGTLKRIVGKVCRR